MRIRSLKTYDDKETNCRMEIGEIMDVDEARGNLLISRGFAEKVLIDVIRIPIFLSYPRPHLKTQIMFIHNMKKVLLSETNLEPRTLGDTDFYHEPPLIAIRNIMTECNGLLVVAFKQTLITDGEFRANSDIGSTSKKIENKWITSPYCHVEPAMALQRSLPIFILRDRDVIQDGVFDNGVLGTYISEFDLSLPANDYFQKQEWKQLLGKWTFRVQSFFDSTDNSNITHG